MRGRPVSPRAYAQLGVFVVALVVVAAVVAVVRATAPEVMLEPVAPAALDPDNPNIVTCQRTLPDAPETLESIAEVNPVGRVTSSDILDCPTAFDLQAVTYIGEVVGDVLQRDGGAWLLVNDDAYALEVGPLQGHSQFRGTNTGLSVWLPAPLPDLQPGGPDRRGTIISVNGIIQRTDPRDGGGLTLTALDPDSTTIVAESQPLDRPLNRGQAVAALLFAVVAAAVVVTERRAARRR